MNDLFFIPETGFENIETVVGDEALGDGELKSACAEAFGKSQVEGGGLAGFPRIDPVGVPGFIDLELETDRESLAGRDGAVARNESGFDGSVADRLRLGL